MRDATGRPPDEWFALLDAQGAVGWSHAEIARWLAASYPDVSGWWIQAITVRFEQERGGRLPGQMADGTFTVSMSRTVDGTLDTILDTAIDCVRAFIDFPPASVRRATKSPTARWRVPEGGTLLVSLTPKANERVQVTLTHSRIAEPARVGSSKECVAQVLESLTVRLG